MEVRHLSRFLTGVPMIGPLPPLHRYLLVLAALLVCAGLGVWAGLENDVPVGVSAGVVAGVAIGLAAAFLLVHDFQRRSSRADGTGGHSH
ncbi:MAG: hypothetical protein AVDCRST_MAG32-1773 [uncultured Nocardioides sp.]|uniref:Uncharacterized protein n=1 Tax=uncultured Nocardioides sp. TaxID=198441 RepID=A0A6J4NAI8_9ACTN|nr:MAG: hypothetical protein AVDCRST_MAG32-1773 [uncultured Nocardioides sp.]